MASSSSSSASSTSSASSNSNINLIVRCQGPCGKSISDIGTALRSDWLKCLGGCNDWYCNQCCIGEISNRGYCIDCNPDFDEDAYFEKIVAQIERNKLKDNNKNPKKESQSSSSSSSSTSNS